MTDKTPTAGESQELQFNEAEYSAATTSGATCKVCSQVIPDYYFQLNGAILCRRCSAAVKAHLTGGAAIPRFLRACVFGVAAAVAGFMIYFGILKSTGYEIGLVSILVGYIVGAAVRKGSGGRGGILYQLIAVLCTYLAIAASYSAVVVPQLIADIKEERAAQARDQDAANRPAENAEKGEPAEPMKLTAWDVILGVGVIGAMMLSLPIVAGFSQPISLLIVGFALWEAFKLNRKVELVITGPHQVGRAPA